MVRADRAAIPHVAFPVRTLSRCRTTWKKLPRLTCRAFAPLSLISRPISMFPKDQETCAEELTFAIRRTEHPAHCQLAERPFLVGFAAESALELPPPQAAPPL